MILTMARVRVMGPRDRLEEVIVLLQDLEIVHLDDPDPAPPLAPYRPSDREERHREQMSEGLDDVEWALDRLPALERGSPPPRSGVPDLEQLAAWIRSAGRVRREVRRLEERRAELGEERRRLERYARFFEAFEALIASVGRAPNVRTYYLVLQADAAAEEERLRSALRETIGDEFELRIRQISTGELAVVLLVPSASAGSVDRVLREAGLEELELPESYRGASLREAVPSMRDRLAELQDRDREVDRELAELSRDRRRELEEARRGIRDRLIELEAKEAALVSDRSFALVGWVPAATTQRLDRALADACGDQIVLEELAREDWEGEEAPVELSNPRIFRPFETITGMLPLPRYGSIDPTPFVAVFFPMFFGVILGDVAYGIVLGAVAGWLHLRSEPGGTLRSISEVAGACALFTVVFGALYGEFLGDLGHRWFGLDPLVMNREEALVPFLAFALALGIVHILLGLVLGAVSAARTDPRHALGRGISALMILLIVVALLAAVDVLPGAFFTPAVVALLVSFPVLVVVEGLLAPLELLSTLGNVLSYARIMALGTASVIMAVVANRLVGALGGALVGVLFGLIFHLVNFALGVFGPVIHGIRLHYVEFFGQFYSPGGSHYRPLRHWSPGREGAVD